MLSQKQAENMSSLLSQNDLLEALPTAGTRTGWPWDEEDKLLPPVTPDGKPWPKITIITPSYNQGQFIEETIRSVLLQGYPNLEYIIIDGCSIDDSVKIIEKYEPWLSYWVSEPDRGQAHAINKGFSMATGDIIQWINSDDLLTPGALAEIGYLASGFPNYLIGGGCRHFDEKGDGNVYMNQGLSSTTLFCFWNSDACRYQQPSLFVPRSALFQSGYLDESLHYCFDFEWTLRLLRIYPITYTQKTLTRFRLHPDSKTVGQASKFFDDHDVIFHRYWRTYADSYAEQKYWMLRLDRLLVENAPQRYKLKNLFQSMSYVPSRLLRRNTLGVLRRIIFSLSGNTSF